MPTALDRHSARSDSAGIPPTAESQNLAPSAHAVSLETEEFRPRYSRNLAVAVIVLAAIGFVFSLIDNPVSGWRYLPLFALAGVAAWAAFWVPAVVVSPSGIKLRNVTRTVEVPWTALQQVDTRYALTLHSSVGSYSSWAATSRSGMADRSAAHTYVDGAGVAGMMQGRFSPANRSSAGGAAAIVNRRWDELRRAGVLNNSRLEKPKASIQWHWRTLALAALLVIAAVLALRVF